jgi:predicted ATPase
MRACSPASTLLRCFRERAHARVHDWDARSPAEITAVAEILRLVDGIPLAIELAAAWVGSKTLPEIRTGLGNRLDLAARRVSDTFADGAFLVELAGTADSESAVVSELVAALAVNPGGFKDEAEALLRTLQNRQVLDVEAVCGVSDVGELLLSLHERSLLVRQEVLGRSRYSMLATVQEYAIAKLPATVAAELRRTHARSFLEVLKRADQTTPRGRLWRRS